MLIPDPVQPEPIKMNARIERKESMPNCKKCKTATEVNKEHACSHCAIQLCRRCDDTSNFLQWWGNEGTDRDGTDLYLCLKCLDKHKKPPANTLR